VTPYCSIERSRTGCYTLATPRIHPIKCPHATGTAAPPASKHRAHIAASHRPRSLTRDRYPGGVMHAAPSSAQRERLPAQTVLLWWSMRSATERHVALWGLAQHLAQNTKAGWACCASGLAPKAKVLPAVLGNRFSSSSASSPKYFSRSSTALSYTSSLW